MLSRYEITKDVLIEDRHKNKNIRFKKVKKNRGREGCHYLDFRKGEIYVGADRTEVGMFLISEGYVEKLSDEIIE